MTATSQASLVAALFGDDGQVFRANGLEWHLVCESVEGVDIDQNWEREATRYTFTDGSVLVNYGLCWDFGHPNCFCSHGAGHDDECGRVV